MQPKGHATVKEESPVHLVRRTAALATADAAAKGCAFLAAVVVARVFGEVGFGALNFAQATAAYALIVTACGMDVYAVKTATHTPEQMGRIAGTVIRLRLAIGAVVFVALGVVAYLAPPLRAVLPLVVLYGLSVFTGAVSLQWITQALRKTHVMGLAVFAGQAAYLVLVLALIQVSEGTWAVPLALVLGELVTVVALWRWAHRSVGKLSEPLSRHDSVTFLRRAAPIGVAQIFRMLAVGSDLVVVGALFTLADAGAYGAGYKIYQLGISAIGLYLVVSFPKLVRTATAHPGTLGRQLAVSIAIVLALGSPALIGGLLFADEALGWVFGSGFAAGADSLRILLATLVVYAVTAHLRNALFALEKQHIDALLTGAAAVVHLVAKIGLAAQLGIEGVALGAFIGELALLILLLAMCRRALRSVHHPAALPVATRDA